MNFTVSRRVWIGLHNCFVLCLKICVLLCLEFFGFKKNHASHLIKLKNMWNELRQNLTEDTRNNSAFQVLLLICKRLGSLPNEYLSFKSTWMIMLRHDRTVDNLRNQLCAYEKVLSNKIA